MIKRVSNVLTLITFSLLFCSSWASAAESPTSGDWQFNLAPFYLWGVSLDGDMSIGTKTVPVDVSFNDIFDSLEAAFIVHFEAMHKSNWGLLLDVNYLDLSNDLNLPMGIRPNLDLDLTLAEFSGLYRIQQDAHNFDLIAGVRYVNIDNTISVANGLNLVDGNQDWLDPLIGGRWIWNFAEDWSFIARGDIGGFGAASDFAWQALTLVEWQPFQYASFIAGFRALYMDYKDGSGDDSFNYDATIYGPVLGLNFKW